MILSHPRVLMRLPFLGPALFGLIVGGIPLGILLVYLGLERGIIFFALLTPVLTCVVVLDATLSATSRSAQLLRRSFVISVCGGVPVPVITWMALLWRSGYEILDYRNLPFATAIFFLCTLAATMLGWPLALTVSLLKRLQTRHTGDDTK